MRKLLGLMAVSGTLLASSLANASHIFFSPVDINGTVLETSAGFTDPNIIVSVGDTVTFHTTLSEVAGGAFTDAFEFDFTAGAGSTLVIADFTTPFTITPGGTVEVNYTVTFATPGTFDGTVLADILASFPDYVIPGTTTEVNTRTFPFQLTVVPEPGSLLLMALGLAALPLIRRRRKI